MSGNNKVTFSVSTIECISCTPVFKRELLKIPGVKSITPFVMMNLIVVDIDPQIITIDEVKSHVLKIADSAGFSGKVVFSRN
jgi:copper chaperone CopZ